MIDEEILELRRKLNESIAEKKDKKEIYKISIALDELIVKYYNNKSKKK